MRELWGNVPPAPADAAFPLQHPILMTVLWCVLMTSLFAPLALRSFQRRARD
jgi:ABC-2 type transport system permease protein